MKKRTNSLIYVQAFAIVAFLLLAIFLPWTALTTVVLAFGAMLVLQGTFAFIDGLVNIGTFAGALWSILFGLISVVAGFVVIGSPTLSLVTLTYILGGWILVSGIIDIIRGLVIRKDSATEIFLILSGMLSIVLAAFVFLFPATSGVTFMWFVGIYLVLWLVFGFSQEERVRYINRDNISSAKGTK